MNSNVFLRVVRSCAAGIAACLMASCDPAIIQLTEVDNGHTVDCSSGDTIEIRLPGNPTTGYLWQQEMEPSSTVLVLKKDTFLTAESEKAMVGVPGTHLFIYEVSGKGKEGIKLIYVRPWEKKPIGHYQVLINAK